MLTGSALSVGRCAYCPDAQRLVGVSFGNFYIPENSTIVYGNRNSEIVGLVVRGNLAVSGADIGTAGGNTGSGATTGGGGGAVTPGGSGGAVTPPPNIPVQPLPTEVPKPNAPCLTTVRIDARRAWARAALTARTGCFRCRRLAQH